MPGARFQRSFSCARPADFQRAVCPLLACAAALLLAGALAGCTNRYYRESADREAYGIIARKASQVPGMEPSFRLKEQQEGGGEGHDDMSLSGRQTPLVLSLAEAVTAAGENSRVFRSRQEDVFLEALDLTLARYEFTPRLSWLLSGFWARDKTKTTTDAPGNVASITTDQTATADSSTRLTKTLATGAQLSMALTAQLVEFVSSDPRHSARSALSLALRQPLWQGGGRKVALEGLTQAERDMAYELRSFVRFRREFFVSVAADYYRLLQQKDVVENQRRNLTKLIAGSKRAEALGEAGILPEFQVGQVKQDELLARDRLVRAQQQYEGLIDEFKITLGLPTDVSLELDPGELPRLRELGLQETGCSERDEAVGIALENRLDFATASDMVADAGRKIEVAANDLRPGVDLVLESSWGLARSSDGVTVTRITNSGYGAGLEIDLPLDKKDERNLYRRALITLDRRQRSFDLLRDRVKQQVYSAWRRLEEARASHAIQQTSVKLANRRVESTDLLFEAGRAEVRDQLEAQEALLDAQNTLTRALMDYRIAMLELWRDMGTLTFKDGEFTEEIPNAAQESSL